MHNTQRREELLKIPSKTDKFVEGLDNGEFNQDELKCLVKEAAFQIRLRREARDILLANFPGGYSLKPAIHNHIRPKAFVR